VCDSYAHACKFLLKLLMHLISKSSFMTEIVFENISSERLYPLVLGFFERKRKLKVLHHEEQSIIIRIGTKSNYFQGRGLSPVGTAKVLFNQRNEDVTLKVEFNFMKWILFPPWAILLGIIFVLFSFLSLGSLEFLAVIVFFLMMSVPVLPFKIMRVNEKKANFTKDLKKLLRSARLEI